MKISIFTYIEGPHSIQNPSKMKCYYPSLDIINVCNNTPFYQNPSICSKYIDQILNRIIWQDQIFTYRILNYCSWFIEFILSIGEQQ